MLTISKRRACSIEFQRFRQKHGRIIADQAKAFGVATSFISDVETGGQPMPEWYVDRFADWLHLSSSEGAHLRSATGQENTKKINAPDAPKSRRYVPQTANEIRALKLGTGA
jgi:hypothetical protein